jgi:hypothetical protein
MIAFIWISFVPGLNEKSHFTRSWAKSEVPINKKEHKKSSLRMGFSLFIQSYKTKTA